MQGRVCVRENQGFTLVEMVVAIGILAFGLLAAGQMLLVAASSASLSRSKGAAAVTAQHRLETLSVLYQQDPLAGELAEGSHGPMQMEIKNPANETTLNCYRVAWEVAPVPDPRPGKRLNIKAVTVSIFPTLTDGTLNSKPGFNKALNVTTILSPETK